MSSAAALSNNLKEAPLVLGRRTYLHLVIGPKLDRTRQRVLPCTIEIAPSELGAVNAVGSPRELLREVGKLLRRNADAVLRDSGLDLAMTARKRKKTRHVIAGDRIVLEYRWQQQGGSRFSVLVPQPQPHAGAARAAHGDGDGDGDRDRNRDASPAAAEAGGLGCDGAGSGDPGGYEALQGGPASLAVRVSRNAFSSIQSHAHSNGDGDAGDGSSANGTIASTAAKMPRSPDR